MRTLLLILVLLLTHGPAALAAALLKTGEPFPSWTLTDQTGASVSSQDLAGKTYVLWFFPKAMTPGCTAEGRSFRDEAGAFEKQGVTILGVSFDAPADNAAFVKAEGFPFRLLSDQDRKLAVAVGAADTPAAPVAHRVSFVVGPDGTVRQVYGTVNPASHAKDVLGDLKRPETPSRVETESGSQAR